MSEQDEQQPQDETPHLIVSAGLASASGATGQQQDQEPETASEE